jgi:hypothetical protein
MSNLHTERLDRQARLNIAFEKFAAAGLDPRLQSDGSILSRCPNAEAHAHGDKTPSFTVSADDERTKVHCHTRCAPQQTLFEMVTMMGVPMFKTAHRNGTGPKVKWPPVLTVAALAEAKKLPVEWLQEIGVKNEKGVWGVSILYDFTLLNFRYRHRLKDHPDPRPEKNGKMLKRFSWLSGTTPTAYGIWRLPADADRKRLILVEGESDCWTLWFNDYIALGIPGVDHVGKLKAEHIEGFSEIIICQDDDKPDDPKKIPAGEQFVRLMRGRLRALNFGGTVTVIKSPVGKDVSDLWIANPNKDAFTTAIGTSLETTLSDMGDEPGYFEAEPEPQKRRPEISPARTARGRRRRRLCSYDLSLSAARRWLLEYRRRESNPPIEFQRQVRRGVHALSGRWQ